MSISKRPVNLRLPRGEEAKDTEKRIRNLESRIASQESQLHRLRHMKYPPLSELLLADLGQAREELSKRRSAGLALEESQLIVAMKYATLIAKCREGNFTTRTWDMFLQATQSMQMASLLLTALQLLSEYVLNELERVPRKSRASDLDEPLQIEDAITPIAGSVLSPHSFMSKDDCLSNFICNDSMRSSLRMDPTKGSRGVFSLSDSPAGTPDLKGPIMREVSVRTKRSSEDFFVVSSSTDMQ